MTYVFAEVMVADSTYHGKEALTYSARQPLSLGAIVKVEIKNKSSLGFVVSITKKPRFKVKEIDEVFDIPPLPQELLKLHAWLRVYYPSPLGVITGLFLPSGIAKSLDDHQEDPATAKHIPQPKLTEDQQQALDKINSPGLHLLHGETGTGKTRVYIELAKKMMSAKKSAIILTPEIGLTSQLLNSFQSVFEQNVTLLHSQMTTSQRQKAWLRIIKNDEPQIVIGPRSALFSPIRNLGLIVVDESHETAYKQDRAPYYNTAYVAAKLSEVHSATMVLGSATPLISDYALASERKRPIIRMLQVAKSLDSEDPQIDVVDIRKRELFSKSGYLSNILIKKISLALEHGEQTLIFLNRRGTARVIFCEKCSWQALCPNCDIPTVYHGDGHYMRCHTCVYRSQVPLSCPECLNSTIVFSGVGTKAIADELKKMFPNKKIQRFDTDNKKSERIEEHFETLQRGDIDIIVGTQTVAKGIDLPKLSLVGVVMADSGLSFPDFSAQERNYQLLHQVMGRVGRGHRKGSVVIQTYNPSSAVLKSVLKKDWIGFSNNELKERKKYKFPPYYYLLKLTCKRSTAKSAADASERLALKISKLDYEIIVEGPAPSFYEKVQGKYQWQIIIKSRRRGELLKIIHNLPTQWSYDIDPLNLL